MEEEKELIDTTVRAAKPSTSVRAVASPAVQPRVNLNNVVVRERRQLIIDSLTDTEFLMIINFYSMTSLMNTLSNLKIKWMTKRRGAEYDSSVFIKSILDQLKIKS